MPALIDQRICDSSPYCSAVRACRKGSLKFDPELNKITVDVNRCGNCPGFCAHACPMNAVKYASTMEEYKRLEAEIANGPSAEELFEQQYGVKPVDPRAEGVNLVHADSGNFRSYVLESPVPVAVDFWAAWCAPCKILAPAFKEIAAEFDGKMRFVKVDTEANPDLAGDYRVMSIPTIAFFANGKLIDRSIGAVTKGQLKTQVEKVLDKLALKSV